MQKIGRSLYFIAMLLSVAACKKTDTYDSISQTCDDPDALNYQQKLTCIYPKNELAGRAYDVTIIRDDQEPWQAGQTMTFYMKNESTDKNILSVTTSDFTILDGFNVKLNGYNYTFPFDNVIVRWEGLYPLTGTGSLANDKFTLNGVIHEDTSSYTLTITGQVHL